ncbi:MAG TPA: UDP-N-acetylmuramoyl-L-alanine--D-glutamate ligase [Acidobacteriota bacterium]|nr:UDP-N-acetylmuramoyl-L-alanine--D-glutamate ligase [Acidobacteriota bacterium]
MDLRGKRVTVVGLARSGVAAARFLASREASVLVTDIKTAEECRLYLDQLPSTVRTRLGGHHLQDFFDSDLVVLSPGVPASIEPIQATRKAGIPVWSEVELASRYLKGRFIGITGSNGKTTTTTLVGAMLERGGIPSIVAGNIGAPLSSFLLESRQQEEPVLVVELSSFQLETTESLRCNVALLLNITPDHMDRYKSFGDYVEAKERIFKNQTDQDLAVINLDDPQAARLVPRITAQLFPFSRKLEIENGVCVRDGYITIKDQDQITPLLQTSEVRLPGTHNLENALAAVAVSYLVKTPLDAIAETLRTFSGVEHRLEWVRRLSGVDYYNDSKATNVDSALRALQSFDRPIIVIMGGLDKAGDFARLVPELERRATLVVLIGKAAEKIEKAIGQSVATVRSGSLEDAVRTAQKYASAGDIVLLAPACASFDMFENFEHRGRVFKECVQALNNSSNRCQEGAMP